MKKTNPTLGMTLPEAIIGFLVASIITMALVLVTKPMLVATHRTKAAFSNRVPAQELDLMQTIKLDTTFMLPEHHGFEGTKKEFRFFTLSQIHTPESAGRPVLVTYSVEDKNRLTRSVSFLNPDWSVRKTQKRVLISGPPSPTMFMYWDGKKLKSECGAKTVPGAIKLIPAKPFREYTVCVAK